MAIGNDFLANLKRNQVVKKTITRSIRDLIGDFQSAKIIIPSYQRTFVWDSVKQCRFIESIFLQIPVPPVFLLEKIEDREDDVSGGVVFEVIDGVQRITTLTNFVNGFLKLTGLETLPDLNQAKFAQLPTSISSLFMERQIDTIIIESGTDPEIQFEVFGRLNQGSVSLNAQELRNCMFHGNFNDFLIDCSRIATYREHFESFKKFQSPKEGKPDKNRMLDVELILRFFSLYELFDVETNKYPDVRTETFNGYMRARNSRPNEFKSSEDLKETLEKVVEIIKLIFSDSQFRSFLRKKDSIAFSSTLNQAVFDVQMLGFVDYNIEQVRNEAEIIYETFLDISSYDPVFIDAISKSTSSKVNERLITWKNRLKDVLENPRKYREKLALKKKLFSSDPSCQETRQRIESLEQADVLEGKLYHRCVLYENDVIKSDIRKSRSTKKTSVVFTYNKSDYEATNINEAVEQILEVVKGHIESSEFDIQRLSSLDFIDSYLELSKKCKKNKKIFKSTGLQKQCSETLYFDASGGRNDVLQQLKEMAELFEFMNDFNIKD